ncbi:hypothetical protein LX36DRAFT_473755 [Colletotrichum falcatum]|nr:hypothetical protein LX36DRAFT_473755 [Colletotrichum falcatum]
MRWASLSASVTRMLTCPWVYSQPSRVLYRRDGQIYAKPIHSHLSLPLPCLRQLFIACSVAAATTALPLLLCHFTRLSTPPFRPVRSGTAAHRRKIKRSRVSLRSTRSKQTHSPILKRHRRTARRNDGRLRYVSVADLARSTITSGFPPFTQGRLN